MTLVRNTKLSFSWISHYKIFDNITEIGGSYFILISLTLLTECSHNATETDHANIIWRTVAKQPYSSNPIDEIYLSSPFGEKFSFSQFRFALLREVMMSV